MLKCALWCLVGAVLGGLATYGVCSSFEKERAWDADFELRLCNQRLRLVREMRAGDSEAQWSSHPDVRRRSATSR